MNDNGQARPSTMQAGISGLVRSPLFLLATLVTVAGTAYVIVFTGAWRAGILGGLALELVIGMLAWQYIVLASRLDQLMASQRRSEAAIRRVSRALESMDHELLLATSAVDRLYLETRRQLVELRRELDSRRAERYP